MIWYNYKQYSSLALVTSYLWCRIMIADIALSRVRGEEQSPCNPVRQHWELLLRTLLLLIGAEVEQHPLLLHSNQALVEPGPLCWGLPCLPALHQVLAADGHLEGGVDDLAGGPEVVQHLPVETT